jgi:hypothetical protein
MMVVVMSTGLAMAKSEDEVYSPGYWKQERHYDNWVGYHPDDVLAQAFLIPPDLKDLAGVTLADALRLRGTVCPTGGAQLLLRSAVAALLNAMHPDVIYPMTMLEVIVAVDSALTTMDRDEMIELKDMLDMYNNGE